MCKDGFSTQHFGVCLCFHHQGFVRCSTFPRTSFIPKSRTATALNTYTRRGCIIYHINLSRSQEHGVLFTNTIFTGLFVQDCTAYNRYENLKPYIMSQAKCMKIKDRATQFRVKEFIFRLIEILHCIGFYHNSIPSHSRLQIFDYPS